MSQPDSVRQLRSQIDEINSQLVHLLNQRAQIALQIANLKNQRGDDLYAPEREEEVHQHLAAINPGPLPNETIKTIFHEIMRGTLSLEGNVLKIMKHRSD